MIHFVITQGPGYLEGTSRRVSIEVCDDVDLFGDAIMVVGELNPNNKILI